MTIVTFLTDFKVRKNATLPFYKTVLNILFLISEISLNTIAPLRPCFLFSFFWLKALKNINFFTISSHVCMQP